MQTRDEKRFANAGDARYLDKYFFKIRYLARKLCANSYNRSNNLHTANKLKFELARTGKSWKYQEISFPARRLRKNLVDAYACCFFYATNAV